MTFYYPFFKTKALTFSYDDGTVQDRKLAAIFRKYDLKATFNINSGTFGEKGYLENHYGFKCLFDKVNAEELKITYETHEIAGHTEHHLHLPPLEDADFDAEILNDFNNLKKLCDIMPIGLAYPYGAYDDRTIERLNLLGVQFARTINDTHTFDLPENFLLWNPTCHDHDTAVMELAKKFISNEPNALSLFFIWGHSFELDKNDSDRWADIEHLCQILSGKNDIWYATNGEICNYINAVRKFESSSSLINNTNETLYIKKGSKEIILKPNETLDIL